MFFAFPIIGLMIFVGFSYWRFIVNKKNKRNADSWEAFICIGGFVLCVLIIITTASFPLDYSAQINDFANLKMLYKKEIIYNNKANSLTRQFASYLATAYPEHEKNIFNSIGPDGIDIYLVKYPELRSADTIMALVAAISKLQTDRYNQQLLREDILKSIRFRTINPWNFYWWIPTLPELEAKYGKLLK